MATTSQSSFTVRRKPLPPHAYVTAPPQSTQITTSVHRSPPCSLDRTRLCEESCHDHSASFGRDQTVPLLSSQPENGVTADATPENASNHTTPRRPLNDSLDVDHSTHAVLLKQANVGYNYTKNSAWTPFWLHWAVLLAFSALFLSLLVGLILLYYFARKHNGISTQISSNHYYWTYGPTSLLMVVVALWRQVDYTCRRLVPWEELGGQVNTQRSLLLDYISPLLLTSLFRAIKFRHWCVVTSLVGFMLLKLITIFSTGLLVLSSTHLSDQYAHLQASHILSAKSHCGTGYEFCNYTDLSIDPVLDYYAILNNRLPYPQGTTSTSMFELVGIVEPVPDGAIITTNVSGFYPDFDCRVATVHNNSGLPPKDDFLTGYNYETVDSIPFDISLGEKTWEVGSLVEVEFCNPSIVICPSRIISTFDLGTSWPSTETATDVPWLLVVNDVRYNQTISPTLNKTALPYDEITIGGTINVTEWSVHVETTTAVLCTPKYSIEDTKLYIDTSQKGTSHFLRAEGPLTHTSDQLENYTDWSLQMDFETLLDTKIPTAFPDSPETGSSMFDLMSRLDAVENNSGYLDPDVLMDASVRAFKILAVQMASQVLRDGGKKNLTGTVVYFEDRLHIKPLSFWVMVVGFASMFGLTLLIFTTRPQTPPPQDPGSLASCACILASRPDLQHRFSNLGSASDTALKQKLSTQEFETPAAVQDDSRYPSAGFLPEEGGSQEEKQRSVVVPHRNWQPLAASNAFQAASLIALCTVIAILAVLQHVSATNNGITNIKLPSTMAHSLYTYIPAAFMLLLATLCTSASFAITTISPYYYMKGGSTKAERTVLLDVCGKSAGIVLYTSFTRLLLAPAFISTASILSNFLTIAVSGLYTAISVPLARPVTVNQLDHFELTWNSSGSDNNAMSILNLLEHSNASFPDFTYEELAIPAIEVTRDQQTVLEALNFDGDLSLSVSVPVMRGSLNCTIIAKEDFGVVENPYHDIGNCQQLACGYGTAGNEPNSAFSVNARPGSYCNLPNRTEETAAVNYSLQLNYPPSSYSGGLLPLAGCPSLAFTLGYFSTNISKKYPHQDSTDKNNVTTFVCSQYLEESVTDVHFLLPSLSIDTARPPSFNTSNSRVVSTEQYNITAYTGDLSNYPLYGYGRPSDYDNIGTPLDRFAQLILSGTSAIPPDELIHPADADRLIVAVQHIYRLYMAQAINANMRQNFSRSTADHDKRAQSSTASVEAGPKVLNAVFLDPTRMRLVQNRASAIVLEGLLGAILVLSVAAYSTTKIRGVLPHNPCSIAGVMSLLAGSQLTRLLPGDAEFWSEKRREEVFRHWRYRLGWWDGNGRVVGRAKGRGEDQGMRFGIDVDITEVGREEVINGVKPGKDPWHASPNGKPLLPPLRALSPLDNFVLP